MNGTYDLNLVALSYGLAAIASFTALELARRVSTASGRSAAAWLAGGSASMGIGIWTMHFVGMLALRMDFPVSYDVPITAASLVVGIVASTLAIFAASRQHTSLPRLATAGLLLGLGVAAMHYTGMAAMRMPAEIEYDTTIVALSVLIAVVASFAALWMAFTLASSTSEHAQRFRVGAALVMGLAICGMHYTGMYAASYTPFSDAASIDAPSNGWLAFSSAAAALFVLGVTHLTIYFDHKLDRQRKLLEQRNAALVAQTETLRGREKALKHEIEERRRAEEDAVYLSALLDESRNEIFVIDPVTLRFTHVSKSACESLGYTKAELLGMTPQQIQPKETLDRVGELIEPLLSGRQDHAAFDAVHLCADGSTYPVEVVLQKLDVHGRPALVAVSRDTTERQRFQTQLQQAQRLESIGQLAAGIAHEINTPTQFVSDNTRFLKEAFEDLYRARDAQNLLHEEARAGQVAVQTVAALDAMNRQIDIGYLYEEIPTAIEQSLDGLARIARIVRAMKEFSHPGSDDKKPIDLGAMIRNVITVSSNEWKYVAEIETDFEENLPSVPAYGQDLSQSILNIIVNAAHAIEAKNGADGDKGRILISTRRTGNAIEIRLSDNGCGMPDDVRKRAFDPFFTTKDVGKGTGQGLSIAYMSIVDKHAGSIEIESAPGVGTTFLISLPLADDEAGGTAADAAA